MQILQEGDGIEGFFVKIATFLIEAALILHI